jgi:membrane-bound lytic murein transglycosylase D
MLRYVFSALLILMLAACASEDSPGGNPVSGSPATTQGARSYQASYSRASAPASTLASASTSPSAYGTGLWARIENGFQIPDLKSDLVDAQVNWYASRPDYVARMTGRSQKYLYYIVDELQRRHMPTELALLPFVESAYNPQALSNAKAAGMWQFMPGTGRTYSLRQNMWQDDRRDVLASTDAAFDYLSRLHGMFGDWYLALAAYNWGESNVQRAIERNQAAGLPTDYLSLRMPAETRNYVPKLQAVKDIVMNPQAYGLKLPAIPDHPYFVTATTTRDIDVDMAARLADVSVDEFRSLNPSFRTPVILAATQAQILLPYRNADIFQRNLKNYTGPLSSWKTYTVTELARPEELAQKLGIDASTLMAVNRIPAKMRLKPGSTLIVPRTDDDDDEDISADVAENAVLAMEPDVPNTRKVLIRVHRHQSVEMVAGRYGVSAGQLRAWNHLRRDAIAQGQVLVLHVPAGRAIPAEPKSVRLTSGKNMRLRVASMEAPSRRNTKHGRVHATIAAAAPSGESTSLRRHKEEKHGHAHARVVASAPARTHAAKGHRRKSVLYAQR